MSSYHEGNLHFPEHILIPILKLVKFYILIPIVKLVLHLRVNFENMQCHEKFEAMTTNLAEKLSELKWYNSIGLLSQALPQH